MDENWKDQYLNNWSMKGSNPENKYMLKAHNNNIRKRCETWERLERHHWCNFSIFVVNFEHVLHLILVYLLLNLNKQMLPGNPRCGSLNIPEQNDFITVLFLLLILNIFNLCSSASIVNFEHLFVCWVRVYIYFHCFILRWILVSFVYSFKERISTK